MFLPKALKLFRSESPDARPLLLELSTDDMIASMQSRALDTALLVRPLGTTWRTLEFIRLFELPVGVIVPPRHRLARRASVGLDEALGEPVVAFIRLGYSD